jgi:predicted amino acid racemase
MTFLATTMRRNPGLIDSAIRLHQEGVIPANAFVLDQDAMLQNATFLKDEAQRLGLHVYFMTKQHGRNPAIYGPATADGRASTVSVDIDCARALHANHIPLGNVGNLCQVPTAEVTAVVERMQPEVISVFSVDKAREISHAALATGRTQDILLRVRDRNDVAFPGMAGGFPLTELSEVVAQLQRLPGVRITGVTTFPALSYASSSTIPEPTANLETLRKAAVELQRLGVEVRQINAPGNTAVNTLEALASGGATHVEPGSAVAGQTTFHLFSDELPERPALVYLTEISHFVDEQAWVYGGGFFLDDPPVPEVRELAANRQAVVASRAGGRRLAHFLGMGTSAGHSFGAIDYHGLLDLSSKEAAAGDSVIFGFRSQLFMTRALCAVVDGCDTTAPRLVGLFDTQGHRLDQATRW